MPKILVLFHYYQPDDVHAAKCFTDLCEDLVHFNWVVEVWPSNRSCHNYQNKFSIKKETINGVKVHRVWRPPWRQHTFIGRTFNAIWMMKYWWLRLLFSPSLKPDVILTGTDPFFSILLSPFLKFIRPRAKIAHWCYDLHPDAALADGVVGANNPIVKALGPLLRWGYSKCDLVVDLGVCMGKRLSNYPIKKTVTLTPWALEEPLRPFVIDKAERKALFGNSILGLLYSGSFGRAHEFKLTLQLARKLKYKAVINYGVRGSRLDELRKAVSPDDTNIWFSDFAPPDKLAARLSAPDVHIVSLRPEWEGIVVPSKFFGALAAGRPVLFEGSTACCIAKWIKEYKVGWVLESGNLVKTVKDLVAFSKNSPKKTAMFKHCREIYQRHFSRQTVVDGWNRELRALLKN